MKNKKKSACGARNGPEHFFVKEWFLHQTKTFYDDKKKPCGVRAGAKEKKFKKHKNIERYIECLLEGGGGGGAVPTANGTNKQKKKNKSI